MRGSIGLTRPCRGPIRGTDRAPRGASGLKVVLPLTSSMVRIAFIHCFSEDIQRSDVIRLEGGLFFPSPRSSCAPQ